MIEHPRFNLILSIVLALSVLLTGVLMFMPRDARGTAAAAVNQPEYVTRLFSEDQVMTIDIQVDASTWTTMLANAQQEQYIVADVVVNGATFTSVGVRPKGNSSLKQTAGSQTSRISLKVEFDHNIKDQTCFGLDKMVLNNTQSDATYMKDYLSYKMMAGMGVPAPLCTFAEITVNGKPWGCYLAVESLENSFAERYYGPDYGQLYNVKSMDGAGELTASENNAATAADPSSMPAIKTGQAGNASAMPNLPGNTAGGDLSPFNKGGMAARSKGGDLAYSSDDASNYSAILGNAVFKPTVEDYDEVITALKNLSTGTDLEKYLNVDEILRYLAVHTVTVNLDSYISNMQQNYYVYEENGQLSILPWDYNLAYGGFQSGDASSVVNFPIDTPVSGVELASRPLIAQLLAVDEYKEKYHEYLQEIVETWLLGGKFTATVDHANALIGDLVKNDTTAFYSYDAYQTAIEQFKLFASLRGQSIQGQLAGTIPATTAGQAADSGKLVDASAINLTALGSQGGGGRIGVDNKGGFNGVLPGKSDRPTLPGNGDFSGKGNIPGGNQQIMPGFGQNTAPGNQQSIPAPEINAADIAAGFTQTSFISSGVEGIVVGVAVLCLLAGLVFVMRFKRRKSYR